MNLYAFTMLFSFLVSLFIYPFPGGEKKRRPSIIRASFTFDSKIRGFSGMSDFVSACLVRDKNFFRKIQFFHFLPSFFAEKWAKNAHQVQCYKAQDSGQRRAGSV